MREHFLGFIMQGEDLPQATNRVDLDPAIRDFRGIPVARTTYKPHRHEIVASQHHSQRLSSIIRDAGVRDVLVATSPTTGEAGPAGSGISIIPISRHVAGTARMGKIPATSVCDEWGRLWEAPNVLVADSSVFPTGSGYGPTLTLVALALRNVRAFLGLQPLPVSQEMQPTSAAT
jgi:choline dehydrogenase-like flavoprotein